MNFQTLFAKFLIFFMCFSTLAAEISGDERNTFLLHPIPTLWGARDLEICCCCLAPQLLKTLTDLTVNGCQCWCSALRGSRNSLQRSRAVKLLRCKAPCDPTHVTLREESSKQLLSPGQSNITQHLYKQDSDWLGFAQKVPLTGT